MVTARLHPRQAPAQTRARQIAEHEAEILRVSDLAGAVEKAIAALVIRIHVTKDPQQREALLHNRADLERYRDELAPLDGTALAIYPAARHVRVNRTADLQRDSQA